MSARDLRTRDTVAQAAANAHADSEPSDKAAALRHHCSRRTTQRWRTDGRGSPPDAFQLYLMNSPHPYRHVAQTKAMAKWKVIETKTKDELIARFHELRGMEKCLEGADNSNDVSRGISWMERARAKEGDAAVDEEISAIMYEFQSRGIAEEEVFG